MLVRGPLQALLMAEMVRESAGGDIGADCVFECWLLAPIFEGQGLIVGAARRADGRWDIRVTDWTGRITARGLLRH